MLAMKNKTEIKTWKCLNSPYVFIFHLAKNDAVGSLKIFNYAKSA